MDVSRDTNFHYSFLVLPPEKRRAIVAVWDFCRAVDDAVDCPTYETGIRGLRQEIGRWRQELDHCYGHGMPATDEGRHLKPYIVRFQLPRKSFEDVENFTKETQRQFDARSAPGNSLGYFKRI